MFGGLINYISIICITSMTNIIYATYKIYNWMGKIMKEKSNKYMGSVKVGQKGQIVIPKEVRDMFDIKSGDTLLLLADSKKGIAIERMGVFNKIADAIFKGRAKDIYPEHSEEDSKVFANKIKELSGEEEKKEDDSN